MKEHPSSTSPLALAQNLIRCPSVTPEEGGALAYIAQVLGDAGFEVHRQTFSAEGTPDVDNLYARWGTGHPHLLFAGHTDVVPPGDASRWTHDPFGAVIANGELYGRGAADMKGGIACMMAAALSFLQDRPDFAGSIGFLITGDEEGPAINGTAKLLDWAKERGERFDHCILGEPTNPNQLGDMIKIGRRGSLTGRVVVHGTQGHVAYPHLADNPIRGMLRLLDALLAEPLDGGTEHFDASNLEVTTIDVGNPAIECYPSNGAGDLQHPLQRYLDPGQSRGGTRPQTARDRRQCGALHTRGGPDECGRVPDRAGSVRRHSWRMRSRRRPAGDRSCRRRAARRTPASSSTPAQWWSSVSWARPCIRWMSALRWRISTGWRLSIGGILDAYFSG